MSQNIGELILTTTQGISDAVSQTTNGIAKIKEIIRTTGISKRQSSKIILESETNMQVAENFTQLCLKNPGILYIQTVGNMYCSNIFQVLKYAQNEFEKTEEVPDVELNNEWLFKFLDISGQCFDEEKQHILGYIGDKVKKYVSYRTLRILKDLTISDISLFKRALYCSLCTRNTLFIPRNQNVITYSEILHLSECELMSSNGFTNFAPKCSSTHLLSCNNQFIVFMKSKKDCDITAPCYNFTESAIELSKFIKYDNIDVEIMKATLKDYTKNYEIALHSITNIDDNIINYEDINLMI